MGGYAEYVWPAFGSTLFIMLILLWLSLRKLRMRKLELQSLKLSKESDPNIQSISRNRE